MRRLLGRVAAGAVVLAACLAGAAVVLDRAFPPDLSRLEAVGRVAVDRDGRTLSAFPAPGGVWRLATSADEANNLIGGGAGDWARAGRGTRRAAARARFFMMPPEEIGNVVISRPA